MMDLGSIVDFSQLGVLLGIFFRLGNFQARLETLERQFLEQVQQNKEI